jgi:hypothetical protein
MPSGQDPRLFELKRLQLALNAASKHLEEFEARVQRGMRRRFSPYTSKIGHVDGKRLRPPYRGRNAEIPQGVVRNIRCR